MKEETQAIKKGDRFLCIQTCVMDDGRLTYIKDKVYTSNHDHCITNENGNETHQWTVPYFEEFFVKMDKSGDFKNFYQRLTE